MVNTKKKVKCHIEFVCDVEIVAPLCSISNVERSGGFWIGSGCKGDTRTNIDCLFTKPMSGLRREKLISLFINSL